MSNQLFSPGREGFLDGTIDYDTGVIKVVPVRAYTFAAAHKFLSDVTTAGGTLPIALASCPALATKTVTDGIADAADTTFTAFPSGTAVPAILLVQASAPTGGVDLAATAVRVIAYIDTGTNFPFTPNGGDIIIAWDNTVGTKIFKL